jgi:hypothetical protein
MDFPLLSSTDRSLTAIRLLDPITFDTGQRRGYFDLTGWRQGPKLGTEAKC